MLHLLLTALAPLVLTAPASLPAGTQLSYRGTIEAQSAEVPFGPKAFELKLWVLVTEGEASDVLWLVEENSAGAFPWPARFGRAVLDGRYRSSALGPAVLFDRGDGHSIVPIIWPLFVAAEPLAADARFSEGKLEYHVEKVSQRAGRNGWKIAVRDPFGPKRTLVVDQQSPTVLELEERVTMGRGDLYRLKLELTDSEPLTKDQHDRLLAAADAAQQLRNRLNVAPQTAEVVWNDAQTELLKTELPAVAEKTTGTPLEALITAARRDLELQVGRNDAVETMRARFVGHAVEDFSIRGTAGERLTADDLTGKVTVLHFWDYRDEPLREPYGQVGYLDFLYQRHRAAGLKVYGIAVNSRLGDETTRGAAERSTRKLKSFMNLSYPVMYDAGGLLKQFGDPRVIGASLPLFVVIGPDGTIRHYHVGNYEVERDQGLKELDEAAAAELAAAKQ